MPKEHVPAIERTLERCVETPSGCWEYQGHRNEAGYGKVGIRRDDGSWSSGYTHRVSYEHFTGGEIPSELVIDHLCRNRACCNPAHLEAVPQRVNVRRGQGHSSETECPQGHPYDEDNTYVNRGKRSCRTCNRLRNRARYHARKKVA